MSKIAVVYWSGTGNTEEMANAVADGAKAAGAEAVLLTSGAFDASMTENYDAIAFGCPSMGAEELEEEEFAPMFEACESRLEGKKIALFGSYGWGDTCRSDGDVLVCDSVICNDAPDEEAVAACKALGAALAAA